MTDDWIAETNGRSLESILRLRLGASETRLAAARDMLTSIAEVCGAAGWDPMEGMPLDLWLEITLPTRQAGE